MTKIMYAYGNILEIVCSSCPDKPCPKTNWLAKNSCPRIIKYNEKIGKVCANCMHCVENKYCSQMRENKSDNDTINNCMIGHDIFKHTCSQWTNTYEE